MFRPYKKKLLIRPDEDAKMTPGGLHIVETRKTERQQTKFATVVSAGESELGVFAPGDRILYTPDVMSPVEIETGEERKLVLIRDSDILGVLE